MSADLYEPEPNSRLVRVVVISEYAMARAGILASLRVQPEVVIVGEFDTCRAAMSLLMKQPPDAVVVELTPGGGDVLDAISRCHTAFPQVSHVVISQTRDHELAERAIKAGAKAVVYKGVGPNGLKQALLSALAGELHLCRCIASPLLHKAIYGNAKHKSKHPDLANLSPREFQIFQLLGAGWDNARIARELGISIKTLNAHKEHLKDRLGFSTTATLKIAASEWQTHGNLASS